MFNTLLKNSPIAIALLDNNLTYVKLNEALIKLLEINEVDFVGKKQNELTDWFNTEVSAYCARALEGEKIINLQLTRNAQNNRTFSLLFSCWPNILDNKIDSITFMVRKAAESSDLAEMPLASPEQQNVYRNTEELIIRDRAIQAVSQGIVITDATRENLITFCSPGFEKITGYDKSEIIGRNCRFLQGKNTDKATSQKIREAILNRLSCSFEILNYRKDGTEFWNQLTISPVKDENGNVTHFVGIQEDITDKRMLEAQLRQAQKMEAIGLLAGGVAHDFNNILALIGLQTESLLEQSAEDSQLRNGLLTILSAQNRATSLTKQLLTFCRRHASESVLFDVDQVIIGITEMLRRLIDTDIEIKFKAAPGKKVINGDTTQFEQLLTNLVVNARDAISSHGLIHISTDTVTYESSGHCIFGKQIIPPGPYVILSVTDNGCGMNASTLERIYEPFFTTKTEGKGTGLGLPIVHGIVRQSNGYINVKSEVNVGTTFEIIFPLIDDKTTETKRTVLATAPIEKKIKILLVEDEADLRNIMHKTLNKSGYDVTSAENGLEALSIYKKSSTAFDLVITDINMPQMGGLELAEELKKHHASVKILFLSGFQEEPLLNKINSWHGHSFMDKPFSVSDLLTKISQIMQNQNEH